MPGDPERARQSFFNESMELGETNGRTLTLGGALRSLSRRRWAACSRGGYDAEWCTISALTASRGCMGLFTTTGGSCMSFTAVTCGCPIGIA